MLSKIKTKVHPLNKDMMNSSRIDSTDDEDCGNDFVFQQPERSYEVRLLTYNLQLIPKSVSSETFVPAPCLLHDERLATMFNFGFLDNFDIVCV